MSIFSDLGRVKKKDTNLKLRTSSLSTFERIGQKGKKISKDMDVGKKQGFSDRMKGIAGRASSFLDRARSFVTENIFTKKKEEKEKLPQRNRTLDFLAGIGSGGVMLPDADREDTFAKDILAGVSGGISSAIDVTTRLFEGLEKKLEKRRIENIKLIRDPLKREKLLKATGTTGIKLSKKTREVSKKIKRWSAEMSPEDPDLADKMMQGVGSMGFFALSNAVSGGSTVVPIVLESMGEMGTVYEQNREAGLSVEESGKKADMVFGLNLVLNKLLNVFDIPAQDIPKVVQVIKGTGVEGMQEGAQQIISNIYTGSPLMEGVLESAGIGALLGGGTTAVLPSGEGGKSKQYEQRKEGVVDEKTIKKVKKEVRKVVEDKKVNYVDQEVFARSINGKVGGEKDVIDLKLSEFDQKNIKRDQVEVVKEQIVGGDKINPIVIDSENNVLDGNHRLVAFKEMGIDKVETVIKGEQKVKDDLTSQAKKFNTAEEFVRADFQNKVIAGQDFAEEVKNIGRQKMVNADGTITLYHGTSSKNATSIKKEGLRKQSFLSLTEKETIPHIQQHKVKEVIPMKVDARDVEFSTGTQEVYAPRGLVLDKDGVWKSPQRAKSQLTDIFNKAKRDVPVTKKPTAQSSPTLKEVTEKQIQTTKDIKGVKSTLRSIRNELSEAMIEAEGHAILAQEQRSGVDVEDINKLKRIYAVSKKFQEGDIETIRSSKWGGLLNSVIENVQEIHPEMNEQEAFDFALNLPTKAQESPRNTTIRNLEKKEKKLSKLLDLLKERQKELKIKEDGELSKEWEQALAIQDNLIKIIKVPSSQVPVGVGKIKVSRLEARLKGVLNKATQEQIDELGLSTYNQMNQKEQVAKALEYAKSNPDEALRVVRGEIDPPSGILKNSVYGALVELGSQDTDLATKVATLSSTRLGQEINILKTIMVDSPVVMMQDITKVRIEAYEKKTGRKAKDRIKKEVDKINKEIKPPSKGKWDSFLDSIKC